MRLVPLSLISIAFAVSVTVVAPVVATDFVHRDDMEVIALNIETGELKWAYKGPPLGFAHFEIYPGLLAVNPRRDTTGKSNAILLDPETGAVVNTETPDPKHLGKATRLAWMGAAVVLENGWKLESFGDGESKNLQFVDPKTSKGVWTVELAEYNERVIAYKDMLLVVFGYLTNEAKLFGYRAGNARPTWTIDFNELLDKPTQGPERLEGVALDVIGNILYAQSGEHVFSLAPESGTIAWRLDAAKAIGINYVPDLYAGGSHNAVFERDGDMLVVGFEKRILGVNVVSGNLIWNMVPDTFPGRAFPLAHNGTVYLSSGAKRTKAK